MKVKRIDKEGANNNFDYQYNIDDLNNKINHNYSSNSSRSQYNSLHRAQTTLTAHNPQTSSEILPLPCT